MAKRNEGLGRARAAKNDEFYTQYADIEREMNAYLDYDKDVFRDKTILLPCDDPEWSNFSRYFAQNFQRFGLKKLISTSYAIESKPRELGLAPRDEETSHLRYDPEKARTHGRLFTLTRDMTGDGKTNFQDLEWEYLEGDGDFRSAEVTALRDEADIIITNPPFSLFREFLAWVVAADKKFAVIGNKNAITYKEVFPLIKDNKIWLGSTPMSVDLMFHVPESVQTRLVAEGKEGSAWRRVDGEVLGRSTSVWFGNLDHGRRHEPLALMTEADNIKFSKHGTIKGVGYRKYDNYDAIEVPFTDAIPSDYSGMMGVPISFLSKYNPDQFEIVGSDAYDGTPPTKNYPGKEKVVNGVRMKSVTGKMGCVIRRDDYGAGTYFDVGYPVQAVYKRIFIRHRKLA